MHQRNHNHRFSRPKPSSTSDGPEESRENPLRAGWTAEGLPFPPLDDCEAEDPLIFFEGLDFEERRIDLPCDEDGQVFLAPHRKLEALHDDQSASTLPDEPEILAQQVFSDDSSVAGYESSQHEFGFKRDDGQREGQEEIEPRLGATADLPFRKEAITDAYISLKVLPDPALQDTAPVDDNDERKGGGEQLSFPPIENTIGSGVYADDKTVASEITASNKVSVISIIRVSLSSFQAMSQNIRISVKTLSRRFMALSKRAPPIQQMLTKKAVSFATLAGGGLKHVAKAVLHLNRLIGQASAPRLHAFSNWFIRVLSRLGRSLATSLSAIVSSLRAKPGALQRASGPWLSAVSKAYVNDIRELLSISKAFLSILKMNAVRSSTYISKKSAAIFSYSATSIGRVLSAESIITFTVPNRFKLAASRSHQFANYGIGRAVQSIRQNLNQISLHGAKGISFVMKTVQRIFMATQSIFEKATRLPAAGLVGVAVGAVFLVVAWSNTPGSKTPSIVLAFPPKPQNLQQEPLPDPIIFDWPAIEALPNEPENDESIDPSWTEKSATESEPFVSPEEAALKGLIEDAASVGGDVVEPSPAKVKPSSLEAGDFSTSSKLDQVARLAVLTLLADIEAITNASEFTKALRAVGLETLIQPGRPYTMLVPSDAAFARLGRDELERLLHPNGHGRLRTLLSNHILEERLRFDDFAGENRSYLSLANQSITIAATDVIKVENASMIETDLRAANTVVHVIDDILVLGDPSNDALLPSATASDAASDT